MTGYGRAYGVWASLNFRRWHMKRIIFTIGAVLFFLGASSIDSKQLAIPMAMTVIGLILMRATKEVLNERD